MKFSTAAVAAVLAVGGASAFTPPTTAFIQTCSSTTAVKPSISTGHSSLCGCASCSGASHPAGCPCFGCSTRRQTTLCAMAVEDSTEAAAPAESEAVAAPEVPAEVEAMDGINSEEEAHNAARPARKSLQKKSKGAPLADFKVGDFVKAKVKTVTTYGAFMDFGAETDGLLHVSNLSVEYVSDVNDVLKAGTEYDVRITNIDETKKQVALSLLTEAQEEEQAATAGSRPANGGQRKDNRRDDGAVQSQLKEKGWDPAKFVTGTVVSTVDFGCFVRVDCSQLNEEITGELDGLVHISAMAAGRVSSVTDIVKPNDTVQVRVKTVENRKVSLTMMSVEDETTQNERGGGGREPEQFGNKDWKEDLTKAQDDMPTFSNKPIIVDTRAGKPAVVEAEPVVVDSD